MLMMFRRAVILLVFNLALALANEIQGYTAASNLFTADVYKEILKSGKENFLVSPFSAGVVLSLALFGARQQTAQELLAALRVYDSNTLYPALSLLLPSLASNSHYTLNAANKIYVKNGYQIDPQFRQVAANLYKSQAENIDFTNQIEAARVINQWVERETHKIKNLLDPNNLSKRTRAVLINALYFQGNWSVPFEGHLTAKSNFYKNPKSTIKVDMMRDRNEYKYYESKELDARFLELFFEGEEASMVVVLPNQIDGLRYLEGQIEKVFAPQPLQNEMVNVGLPKFKIETKLDFKEILKNLGVKKAFQQGADFSGISANKNDLILNKIIQKTFVDVNEQGVEAAAASYIDAIVPLSGYFPVTPPKEFIVDHPFMFYIKVRNLILFAGKVSRPQHY